MDDLKARRKPIFQLTITLMRTNTLFTIIALIILITHVGSLAGVYFSSRGLNLLLALNATCAVAILIYLASRAPYIIAAKDGQLIGLFIFEIIVLLAAILAYRDSRIAMIESYAAFGLHACASLAAVVFAFTFKITKLM